MRNTSSASQVLNVPLPEVYLQPEQPGEILLANCEEKGQLLPSFVKIMPKDYRRALIDMAAASVTAPAVAAE